MLAAVQQIWMQLLSYTTTHLFHAGRQSRNSLPETDAEPHSASRNTPTPHLYESMSAALEECTGDKAGTCNSILLDHNTCQIQPASDNMMAMPLGGVGCATAGVDNTLRVLSWCKSPVTCRVLVVGSSGVLTAQELRCESGVNEIRLSFSPHQPGNVQMTIVDAEDGCVFATMTLLALPQNLQMEMDSLCKDLLVEYFQDAEASSSDTWVSQMKGPRFSTSEMRFSEAGPSPVSTELLSYMSCFDLHYELSSQDDFALKVEVVCGLVAAWHKVIQPILTDYSFLLGCGEILRRRTPGYVVLVGTDQGSPSSPNTSLLDSTTSLQESVAEEVLQSMLSFLVKKGRMGCVELLLEALFSTSEESSKQHATEARKAMEVSEQRELLAVEQNLAIASTSEPESATLLEAQHSCSSSMQLPCNLFDGTTGTGKGTSDVALSDKGFLPTCAQLFRWCLRGFPNPVLESLYYLQLCHKGIFLDYGCALLSFYISLSACYRVLVSSRLMKLCLSMEGVCTQVTWQEFHLLLLVLLILFTYNAPHYLLLNRRGIWLQRREQCLLVGFMGVLAVLHIGLAVGLMAPGREAKVLVMEGAPTYSAMYSLRAFSVQARFPRYLASVTVEVASLAVLSWTLGQPWYLAFSQYSKFWLIFVVLGLGVDMCSRLTYSNSCVAQARQRTRLSGAKRS